MTRERRAVGTAGEDAAAAWYEAQGWIVVDRNWRCREGELDLVVRRGATTVFCEVKTRRSRRFGAPVEAVTLAKQRQVRLLARRWLADHPGAGGATTRFDVASVMPDPRSGWRVEVVEAAF